MTENEAIYQIHIYHTKEIGHGGIEKTLQGILKHFYSPVMKKLVTRHVNNCDICNKAQHFTNPIKPKFEVTKTPENINHIFHIERKENRKIGYVKNHIGPLNIYQNI